MITIIKRNCFLCKKILSNHINWYFYNDNIFCSKSCRKILYFRS